MVVLTNITITITITTNRLYKGKQRKKLRSDQRKEKK